MLRRLDTISTVAAFAGCLAVSAMPAAAQCNSSKTASADSCQKSASIALAAFSEGKRDIVDTAVNAGSFQTLVTAVKAAHLVEALKGDGPFTVFAPTDAAFGKLPSHTIKSLLEPANRDTLASILKFHVVPGKLMARDVTRLSNAKSLNGQAIDFTVKNGEVTANGARVVSADIECTNGIIHVIDTVIMPSSDDIVATASSTGMFNTLLAAAKAAGLVGALQGDGPLTVLAPTDEAFAKLGHGTIQSLLEPRNRDKLATILKYHVISGRAFASDAVKAGSVNTLTGDTVVFGIRDGRLFADNAKVIATDIDASNGVIHVIDTVIMPPSM